MQPGEEPVKLLQVGSPTTVAQRVTGRHDESDGGDLAAATAATVPAGRRVEVRAVEQDSLRGRRRRSSTPRRIASGCSAAPVRNSKRSCRRSSTVASWSSGVSAPGPQTSMHSRHPVHFHGSIVAANSPPVPGTSPSIASKNGRVRATGKVARVVTSAGEVAQQGGVVGVEGLGRLGHDLVEGPRGLVLPVRLAHPLGQAHRPARAAPRAARRRGSSP